MWKQLRLCFVTAAVACGGQTGNKPEPSAATTAREPATDLDSADSVEGKHYLEALVAAIDSAERIVVTEHSSEYDGDDEKAREALRAEPVFYATKELSQAQRAAFRATIAKLDPAIPDAFAACIFEPHHTVTFFNANQQPSEMLICFECGDVRWEGTSSTAPESLIGGLGRLISSVGLPTHRDWRALAEKRSKNER